ncbi:hypothetical protein CDAR_40341 [Caerostris darwini]|uniref:Uncharacterized protein n=1 Tax=Caerostris darwini TaxID=1538125 RepID=A0AAV4RD92_9ARAC|nr:hypothetical protein CDAR_40341 [Caerostris darwini]
MIPRMDFPRAAGPSRNFISALAPAGLQGRPAIRRPEIMGLESAGQSLKKSSGQVAQLFGSSGGCLLLARFRMRATDSYIYISSDILLAF